MQKVAVTDGSEQGKKPYKEATKQKWQSTNNKKIARNEQQKIK